MKPILYCKNLLIDSTLSLWWRLITFCCFYGHCKQTYSNCVVCSWNHCQIYACSNGVFENAYGVFRPKFIDVLKIFCNISDKCIVRLLSQINAKLSPGLELFYLPFLAQGRFQISLRFSITSET